MRIKKVDADKNVIPVNIDEKFINLVRDSTSLLLIRVNAGLILSDELKLLIANLAWRCGCATCECEQCRSDGPCSHARIR
jgi:hypothetical protein